MAKEEAPIRTQVGHVTPLDSALKTFVGRDENGLIYSRLEYMLPAGKIKRGHDRPGEVLTQIDVLPNLMRGIISRLGYTHPEYVERLALQLPDTLPESIVPGAVYTSSGELSQKKLQQKLALAQNVFGDDPLVSLSREASGILSSDGLDQLGKFVLASSVAVVEYMQIPQSPPDENDDPNAAA